MGEFRRGWRVVVAALIGVSLSSTNILIYTIGMFMPQLHREFGWSLQSIQMSLLVSTVMVLVAIPIVAWLSDKVGARTVAILSAVGLSLGLMSHALLTDSIWTLYLATGFAAIAGSGTLALTWTKLVALWFDEHRGLALGTALIGTGVGGALLKPITAVLISHFGWRGAYVGVGLLPLLLAVPVAALWFRPPVVPIVSEQVGHYQTLDGMTYAEALKDWRFWALGVCFVPVAVAIGAMIANMETILAQQGMAADRITTVVTFIGVAVIVGRIVGGYLLDRTNAGYLGASLIALIAVACLLVASPPVTFGRALAAVVFVGLGSGVEFDVMAFLAARLFGLRAYSRIYGGMLMFYFLGGAIGPVVFGAMFDHYQSFRLPLLGTAASLVLSLVLMLVVASRLPRIDHAAVARKMPA